MDGKENKLSFENATHTAKLLSAVPPNARVRLFNAKRGGNFSEFQKIAFENRLDAKVIWSGIDDIYQQQSQGVEVPIGEQDQEIALEPSGPTGIGAVGLGAGAIGGIFLSPGSYKDSKETAEYRANYAAAQWDREEEEYKKSGKTPPPERPRSREEVYERAHSQYYDELVAKNHHTVRRWASKNPDDHALAMALNKRELQRKNLAYQEFVDLRKKQNLNAAMRWKTMDPKKRMAIPIDHLDLVNNEFNDTLILRSPEQAKEWFAQHNDPQLQAAIQRKEKIEEEERKKSRVKKKYHDSGLEEKVNKTKKKLKESRAGKLAESINDKYKKLTDIPSRIKDRIAQTWIAQKLSSANKRIRHFFGGPGRQYGRFKKWFSNTRVGKKITSIKAAPGKLKKKITSSSLGRFTGKLKGYAGKLKNLLNPLNFLVNFIKKSIIGAAISAITTVITTVISLAVVSLISIVGLVIGGVALIAGFIIAVIGWPILLIAGIALLMVVVFLLSSTCLVFCDQETREFIDSPYPGISYSISAPETLQNGLNINYNVIVLIDTTIATDAPEDLTAVANIPPGTTFISATGTYSLSDPGKIRWKLYPENSNPKNEGKEILSFVFELVVRPQNDIVVENLLTIEGASGGAPPIASGIAPNDTYCEDRKYGYVLDNKLLPKNFGDPDCTLDTYRERNDLYDLLKQKDPQWADFWFDVIIPGESSYAPNNWGCGDNDSAWDPIEKRCREPWAERGAWGLFQMGSSNPPGELKARGGTRGDVTWKEQVENAVNHNKVIDGLGLRFKYWLVAIEYCRDGNMNEPQCRDM